jgi:hypothetical protein
MTKTQAPARATCCGRGARRGTGRARSGERTGFQAICWLKVFAECCSLVFSAGSIPARPRKLSGDVLVEIDRAERLDGKVPGPSVRLRWVCFCRLLP